jgi:hypothetical protein
MSETEEEINEEWRLAAQLFLAAPDDIKICFNGGCAIPTRLRLAVQLKHGYLLEPFCSAHALWILSGALKKLDLDWRAPEGSDEL